MTTEASADIGQMTQFDWLYNALANRYPGIKSADGKASLFQFMSTPMSANWTTGTDSNAYALADSTSVNMDGFFVQGDHLSIAYRQYVTSIVPDAGNTNQDYQKLVVQIAAIDNNVISLSDKARAAFKLYQANNPGTTVTFQAWIADPFGGKSYGDQLDSLESQRSVLVTEQTAIVQAIDAPLAAARAAVCPNFVPSMNVTYGGGAPVQVAAMQIGGDLASDVNKWSSRDANAAPDFDVTLKSSDTITSPWKTTYETKTKVNCWGASTKTKVNTSRIIQDVNYSLRVQAVGMNTYKIDRAAWFDAALVKSQRKIVQGSPYTDDSFFGEKGTLHLLPQEILVMFRPKIELTMTTEVYKQEIEGKFNANLTWIDLLGMRFQVSGLSSLKPVDNGDNTTTITLDSAENQAPYIVGITSEVVSDAN